MRQPKHVGARAALMAILASLVVIGLSACSKQSQNSSPHIRIETEASSGDESGEASQKNGKQTASSSNDSTAEELKEAKQEERKRQEELKIPILKIGEQTVDLRNTTVGSMIEVLEANGYELEEEIDLSEILNANHEDWIDHIKMSSEYGNIEFRYRNDCNEPQSLKQCNVSRVDFTKGKNGAYDGRISLLDGELELSLLDTYDPDSIYQVLHNYSRVHTDEEYKVTADYDEAGNVEGKYSVMSYTVRDNINESQYIDLKVYYNYNKDEDAISNDLKQMTCASIEFGTK